MSNGLSILSRLVKQAGASAESDTERDGALSYSGESHAAGIGFGVGLLAGASGNYRIAGLLLASLIGVRGGDSLSSTDALADAKKELPYSAGGIAGGILLGSQL